MSKSLLFQQRETKPPPIELNEGDQRTAWLWIGALSLVLVAVYFDSFSAIENAWRNPQYSHGYLIPLFAAVLLWMRRQPFTETSPGERWCGVGLIAAGLLLRVVSAHYTTFTTDHISFIPCLMGVFVIVGGLRTLRWAGLPVAFLIFMYPWPDFLVRRILVPLKTVATQVSLYALQTLGVESYLNGSIIELGDGTRMNVVDACSGLRMLTIFLALAAAIAMIMRGRPYWERITVFVSAVPIALIVNALRITVTGLIYAYGGAVLAEETVRWLAETFHDQLAPYFMMPLALLLLYLEYQILKRLIIEEESPQQIRRRLPVAQRQPGKA